jgi:hypothetical protein
LSSARRLVISSTPDDHHLSPIRVLAPLIFRRAVLIAPVTLALFQSVMAQIVLSPKGRRTVEEAGVGFEEQSAPAS